MRDNYSFSIQWSEEDEGFIATSPEFPGLSAFGETREEALTEAEVALSLFVESYEADHEPLPTPNEVKQYSGQFRVRLPRSLHARLVRMAEADGVSLNSMVIMCLSGAISLHELRDEILESVRSAFLESRRTETNY